MYKKLPLPLLLREALTRAENHCLDERLSRMVELILLLMPSSDALFQLSRFSWISQPGTSIALVQPPRLSEHLELAIQLHENSPTIGDRIWVGSFVAS